MADGLASALQGRKIVLCVTGGIAAYKVVEVARTLTQLGADVRVVMTHSALEFVGAQTFAALTGNPVSTGIFGEEGAGGRGPNVPHVELARGADRPRRTRSRRWRSASPTTSSPRPS
jgi:phosphopantothenoylcysteine decarboxylase/phosphopantothenate--cysteine ligase